LSRQPFRPLALLFGPPLLLFRPPLFLFCPLALLSAFFGQFDVTG
jgi:hypothetical protein